MTKKVALGMSGGVDSSTSVKTLQEQGYEVHGVYLAGLYPGAKQEAAITDVKRVAEELKISWEVVDLGVKPQLLYDYFVETYRQGRTPNVCTICNAQIKFGWFYQWALSQGFDYVATGHYARLQKKADNGWQLKTAVDESKDQTYFLALVDEDVWARVLFPVGAYRKTEIRQLAAKWQLPVAEKKESMEVCFLQDQKVKAFLQERIQSKPGEIVWKQGDKLIKVGNHQGLAFYTLGQRQGVPIEPITDMMPALYVIAKEVDTNRLIVGEEKDLGLQIINCVSPSKRLKKSLIEGENYSSWRVRIRHRGELITIKEIKQVNQEHWQVTLKTKARAPAPGQFAVFYEPNAKEDESWLVVGAAEMV
ncbi:tRNA 2-thiouridine(34) synthase MnmA [bacterium]|nr:tRNA 2-thiouridine(34) synthase MnmA [bacterium]